MTVVIPPLNVDPESGLQATSGEGSTLSVAGGSVHVTTGASVIMLVGQAPIEGGSKSKIN